MSKNICGSGTGGGGNVWARGCHREGERGAGPVGGKQAKTKNRGARGRERGGAQGESVVGRTHASEARVGVPSRRGGAPQREQRPPTPFFFF